MKTVKKIEHIRYGENFGNQIKIMMLAVSWLYFGYIFDIWDFTGS